MTYIEILNFKKLLKQYLDHIILEQRDDSLCKIDDDILENLAIIVSRNMKDGEKVEEIIKNNVKKKIFKLIDKSISYNLKNGTYIDPEKLKNQIRGRLFIKLY